MTSGTPVVMPSLNAPLQGGIRVHSVLSGDTIVVRPVQMASGVGGSANGSGGNTSATAAAAAGESGLRVLHVAGLAAPRMGSRERDDEVRVCGATTTRPCC